MQKIINKLRGVRRGLLPVACLTAMSCVAHAAPSITMDIGDFVSLSRQGNIGNSDSLGLGTLRVTLDSNLYATNDRLFLMFENAELLTSGAQPTADINASKGPCDQAGDQSDNPDMQVSFLNYVDASGDAIDLFDTRAAGIEMRVVSRTALDGASTAVGCEVIVNEIVVDRADALLPASTDETEPASPNFVAVDYYAVVRSGGLLGGNDGSRFDQLPNTRPVVVIGDEMDASIGSSQRLDAIVDVNQENHAWADPPDENGDYDSLRVHFVRKGNVQVKKNGVTYGPQAFNDPDGNVINGAVSNYIVTIRASRGWGYVATNTSRVVLANQILAFNELDADITSQLSATVSSDLSTLTVTVNGAADLDGNATKNLDGELTLRFVSPLTSGRGDELDVQQFEVDARVRYDNGYGGARTHLIRDLNGGSWGTNGAQVYVPAIFVGGGFNPILTITNRSNLNSRITLEAFNQNGVSCVFDAGDVGAVVGARGSINLGKVLLDELESNPACSGVKTLGGARLSLIILVKLPADAIDVYSAYSVKNRPESRTAVPNRKL